MKTQADWLAGRLHISGGGTVGAELFPAHGRCYTEREGERDKDRETERQRG